MHAPKFSFKNAILAMATFIYVACAGTLAYLQWAPGGWFMTAMITVPDHRIGEDPTVHYEREILTTARRGWEVDVEPIAEVNKILNERTARKVCGHGEALYTNTEKPALDMKLTQFLGNDRCAAKSPGGYQMQVCFDWQIWIFTKNYCTKPAYYEVTN